MEHQAPHAVPQAILVAGAHTEYLLLGSSCQLTEWE